MAPGGQSLDTEPPGGLPIVAFKMTEAKDARDLPDTMITDAVGGAGDLAGVLRSVESWRPKDDGDGDGLRDAVTTVEARLATEDPVTIGIERDASTGFWCSRWLSDVESPQPAGGKPFGRIVIVGSSGVSVGSEGRHTSRYCYVLDAPDVDLTTVFDDAAVRKALVELSADPHDTGLRAAAVRAVLRVQPQEPSPWRELALPQGDTSRSPGSGPLDGTIAIIGSRGVSIGRQVHHCVTFVATLSPTLDGALAIAGDRRLAGSVVDLACNASSAATRRLAAGMTRNVAADMAGAPELLRVTRVEDAPGPGEVLTVRHELGAVVGPDVRVVDRHEFDVRQLAIELPELGSTLDNIVATESEAEPTPPWAEKSK
jgi:hypothetical protein